MRKGSDGERPSGLRIPFVWDTSVSADAETSEGTVERRISRKRVALLGSGALVLVVGAGYGAHALMAPQHPDTAGAAAMTRPSPVLPTPSASASASAGPSVGPSPSASPSPSRSATPSAAPTAAAAPRTRAAAPKTSDAPAVVAAPPAVPAPAGNWLLNQTTGNTAVDSTGAHNGTAQDGWWAGGTFLVNGTNSQIYTDGPVLATGSGRSFTVSAWVDMTALPTDGHFDETAVSQDGGVNSAFYLQFTEPDDRWAFSRTSSNSGDPGVSRAESASAPALSTWTHLVGVYNAADHTQYLYVNGVAQGTATDSSPFAAPGDLAIGRAQYNGQETDWFKGAIKKVEVFDSALSAAQVSELS